MFEICWKLTVKIPENEVNDFVLVSLLLIWTDFTHLSGGFIAECEQLNVGWIRTLMNSLHFVYLHTRGLMKDTLKVFGDLKKSTKVYEIMVFDM